jgi:hypothetical protein
MRAPDLPVVAPQDADSFLNQMMITEYVSIVYIVRTR